jgi:hypothetical protein
VQADNSAKALLPLRKLFNAHDLLFRPVEDASKFACCLASGTSKKYRSLLLALSSSTINMLSEYIIFTPPFCDHRVFVRMLPESLNCQRDQDQMQDFAVVGKNYRLENSEPAGYLTLSLSVMG